MFQKKYVWLKTENTQESFLSDMIRNRFPESSLILSSSSHSPLLSLTEISCSDIILSVTLAGDSVTLGTEHSVETESL